MTLDEARSHIGSGVLYCTATAEAQYAEIARVFGSWVFVRCSSDDRTKPGRAGGSDAACRAGHRSRGSLTAGDLVAASQASLNEIVAAIIRGWARKLLAGRECAQCASLSQLGIRIHIRR
jgi:hypothetical protein